MKPLARVLAAAVCSLVLLAGCSESDSGLDERAAERSTTTEAESSDDGAGAEDDDAAVDDAVQAMQDQGFSEDGARCMIDSMVASGITPEQLEQIDSLVPDQEFMDAAGDAGAACASEIAGDIPEGAIDLENPVVREQFVRTFAQTSGLTLEQSDCVAQYFIDNGVDYDALIAAAGGAQPDEETARQVNGALESCA